MGLGDKHQKKDVEAALKRAEAAGLKVTHDKNGHRRGWIICCPCKGRYTVSSTPRNPGAEANKINGFIEDHRGCA